MKRLAKYLAITFLITWICWAADALIVKFTAFTSGDIIPMALFTLGGFGPPLAACFCLDDGFSWKKLKRLFLGNNPKGIWYLLLFLALEIATFGLSSMELNMPVGTVMVLNFLACCLIYGGNEELGWRGTMQPIMQNKMPYPLATLIVGAVWAVWHLPLWFIEGDSHQDMSFIFFAILAVLLSFWLSAVYNASKSVLFCMIFHGMTNTLMGVFVIKINPIFIAGLAIMTALSVWISISKLKNKQGDEK